MLSSLLVLLWRLKGSSTAWKPCWGKEREQGGPEGLCDSEERVRGDGAGELAEEAEVGK